MTPTTTELFPDGVVVADPVATLEWFKAELAAAGGVEPWAGCRDAIEALERAWAAPPVPRPEPPGSSAAHAALRQLALLGKDPAKTWFRTIRHGKGANGRRKGADLHGFDEAALRADAAQGASLYLVVGEATAASGVDRHGRPTGAVIDNDIEAVPALFVEWDSGDIAEQLGAWQRLGLPEPTLMLTTGGKSAHVYWRLREPLAAAEWKAATARLIAFCKSDKACSNTSRVMRLAGSRYVDKETGKQTGARAEIVHEAPEAIYDLAQLLACLPPAPAPSPAPSPAPRRDHDARPLVEVREALLQIPPILPQNGQREQFRSLAWGLLCAVREAGSADSMALALLEEHSPAVLDAAEYLQTEPHSITAATFWHLARQAGWRPLQERGAQPPAGGGMAAAPATAGGGDGVRGLPWLLARLDRGTGPAGARKTTAGDLAQDLLMVAGDRLRFNELRLLPEIDGEPIEGHALDTLHVQLQLRGMNITAEAAGDALVTAALQRRYHPVREYLDRVAADPSIEPLDLTALVGQFLRPGDPAGSLQSRMLAKTLIGAVARAFQPGCKLDTCCVLVGGQGAQKSTFWQEIAGPPYYSSSSLGSLDKDALMLVHSAWFLEAAELETITSRRAAGELKGFLSTAVDHFRVPYGRTITRRPRGSVMVGTSNRTDFLTDETGSRRFWIIPVITTEIDVAGVRAIRDRIWKSAALAYRRGERWWLDKADEAASEIENQQFAAGHPWEGPVGEWLESRGSAPFTSAEALVLAGLRQRDQIQRRDEMALATVLGPMGWVQRRGRVEGERKRMWFRAEDVPVPTVPTCPDLESDRLGRADASQDKRSGKLSQPSRPKNEDSLEKVASRGQWHTARGSTEKRSGQAGQGREACQRNGSAVPTSKSEVGTRLGQAPEVGTAAPSTVRGWAEAACEALRLAPDPVNLQSVADWLDQHPAQPGCTRAALAVALDRLRADEGADTPLLFPEVLP
jgi:hypothetical protein